MSALGVESGIWFAVKLQNQSAADSAAISAAYQVIAGKTDVIGELTAAAGEAARRNGYKGRCAGSRYVPIAMESSPTA